MFYTVYRITNLVNGKIYVGKHKTTDLNDGYMGSGKLIRQAISKYGLENFHKEILFVFDNEEEMNAKEAEIVVISENSYNLTEGGKGGFSYINQQKLNLNLSALNTQRKNGVYAFVENMNYHRSVGGNKAIDMGYGFKEGHQIWVGRNHTDHTKDLMRKAKIGMYDGKNNPAFGTKWITNGSTNKKILKTESIPDGWYSGRKM